MNASPPIISFSPGSGLGVVTWPTVALIELADLTLAERLWQRLVDGGDGNDLIDELSVDGLRSLGSFVVAQVEGPDIRLFVRGRVRVRYTGEDDSGEIDGSSVRTWIERVVSGCRSISMAIDGPVSVEGPYRVSSGLVPALGLSWIHSTGSPVRPAGTAQTSNLTTIGASAPPTGESASAGLIEVPQQSEPADDLLGLNDVVEQTSEPGPPTGSEPTYAEERSTEPGSEESCPDEEDASEGKSDVEGISALDVVDTGETLHYHALDGEGQPLSDSPVVDAPLAASDSKADNEEYDYDALFGRTTHRSVQDAAVDVPIEPELDASTDGATDLAPQHQLPKVDLAPESASPVSGLISGIPSTPTAAEPPGMEDPGDHDGMTMTVAQLRALRASGEPTAAPSPPAVGGGPTVQALVCGAGHANPTVLAACRHCGAPLASAQVVIPRPSLGRIGLSSGQSISLTRSAIVGRNPRVEGTMHGEVPSTVKVEGVEALSRSHAIIRLEGWQVMVEDLDSANGTTVTLQGRAPRRLRAGEPMILEHGALIDFGGEVTGTYDALG